MIKLYSFCANFGVTDPSPFVLKIDAYLRMSGIEYETVSDLSNLRKAPKGKLPFIEDGGELIADSFFIAEHLKEKYGDKLDQWLSDEQKSTAHLVTKALDEDLYWCLVYSRWMREDTWPMIREAFFGAMPFPLKQIVPVIARSGVRSALKKQGLGRHSDDEIKQILKRSLNSLAVMLGDKAYFLGDKPCSLDATTFAFLAEFILVKIDNSFNEVARRHENLVQYCKRMQAEFYAEP